MTAPYTGLPVPAHSALVIEGDVPPPQVESRNEEPSGEWPGYYGSGEPLEPVIKVKSVLYPDQPVICGAPALRPPANGTPRHVMRAASVWSGMERLGIPGIKGVWFMRARGARFLNVISIEQKYAGHIKQGGMAAMSGAEGAYTGRSVI